MLGKSWLLVVAVLTRASAVTAVPVGDMADVESSLTTYTKAREREAILEKAAKASRQAEEMARVQYKEGIASLLDVLDAQRQRLETETTLLTARANVGQSYAALYKALGGGAYFHIDRAKQ
jgi:outer membrane protein TolC